MGEILVYHVTAVEKVQSQPSWPHIRPSVLRDRFYDGPLVGLRLVSTSCTLLRGGGLPSWTPYPTTKSTNLPTSFWRAKSTIRLADFRVFQMFARAGRNAPKQVQLLFCNRSCPIESDFAVALGMLGFTELVGPDYGGVFQDGKAPEYQGGVWFNCFFLDNLKITAWDVATKRHPYKSGKLVRVDARASDSKLDVLCMWLSEHVRRRSLDDLWDTLPSRFLVFEEPDTEEYLAQRRAATLLGKLPVLYAKSIAYLGKIDFDLKTASEAKISRELKKAGMPPLCITCLNAMSNKELTDHLVSTTLKDDSHIYNLKAFKKERELVRLKIKDDSSNEAHMVKLIFAVKHASLVKLPMRSMLEIRQRIRDGREKRNGKEE